MHYVVGHSILIQRLTKGSFFGEDALLGSESNHVHRTRTVVASVDTELNYIEKDAFIDLKETAPGLEQEIKRFAKQRKHDEDAKVNEIEARANRLEHQDKFGHSQTVRSKLCSCINYIRSLLAAHD